jgi:hypothetical protein
MERILYRWAWLAVTVGSLIATGVITCRAFRYHYVKFDLTGGELTSVVYDRWLHRTCFMVLTAARTTTAQCWDGDHLSALLAVHPAARPK